MIFITSKNPFSIILILDFFNISMTLVLESQSIIIFFHKKNCIIAAFSQQLSP